MKNMMLLFTLFTVSSVPLLAQAGPVTGSAVVTLRANETTVQSGGTITVGVRVDLSEVRAVAEGGSVVAAVLGGYQIAISFSAERLQFVSASGGTAPGFTAEPVSTSAAAANEAGRVIFTAAQTSSSAPTGLVEVAAVTFKAVSPGAAALNAEVKSLATAFLPAVTGSPALIPSSATGLRVSVQDGSPRSRPAKRQ